MVARKDSIGNKSCPTNMHNPNPQQVRKLACWGGGRVGIASIAVRGRGVFNISGGGYQSGRGGLTL